MTGFKKIAIAIDGSINSRDAVDAGIELAGVTNASVDAIYVIHSSLTKSNSSSLSEEGKKATDYVKNEGEEKGVDVKSVILEGNPAEKIIEYAEKNDADLVVMGTKGHSGIKRFMLGSVAENVVRHSMVPVMIVQSKFTQPVEGKRAGKLSNEEMREQKLREKREHVKYPD